MIATMETAMSLEMLSQKIKLLLHHTTGASYLLSQLPMYDVVALLINDGIQPTLYYLLISAQKLAYGCCVGCRNSHCSRN